MGLLDKKEVDGIVYEIYITHLYKEKWVNFPVDLKSTLERGYNLLFDFRIKDNKIQTKEKHPYATVCKVIIYNEDNSIPILEVEDKVICHPKDQFSRKVGRRLSFNKVITKLKELNTKEDIEILETLIK